MTTPPARRRWRVAALGAIAAIAMVSGCDEGHRFQGPSVTIQNDTQAAVVARVRQDKWPVGPGEARQFFPYANSETSGATVELLDGTSCATIAAVEVSFVDDLDPLVTVPASGPPAQSVASEDQRKGVLDGIWSQNVCPSAADGWTVSIVNHDDQAYQLITYDAEGAELASARIDGGNVGPLTQRLRDPHSNSTAGSFVLVDQACSVLDRVHHPPWGTLILTIEHGAMTIQPGVLADEINAIHNDASSCRIATASPN